MTEEIKRQKLSEEFYRGTSAFKRQGFSPVQSIILFAVQDSARMIIGKYKKLKNDREFQQDILAYYEEIAEGIPHHALIRQGRKYLENFMSELNREANFALN